MNYIPFSSERWNVRNHATDAIAITFDGANYVYTTPFGTYTWLQPGNLLKFDSWEGEELVSKSVYVLQYLSGTTWLSFLNFINTQIIEHTVDHYRYTYDVQYKYHGHNYIIGSVTIDFNLTDHSKEPKTSVAFIKSADWATAGLTDFRWIWDISPNTSGGWKYHTEETAERDEEGAPIGGTTDITTLSTAVSKGNRSQMYLAKSPLWNGDSRWVKFDTSAFGAVEQQIGSEPFWNGKGTVSIFPVNAAVIDPDIAYTEMMDNWTDSTNDGLWADYDIHANKGVPHGSVVEIVGTNPNTNAPVMFDLRTDGSSWQLPDNDLFEKLDEAESGGENCETRYVQVDVNTGLVEFRHPGGVSCNYRILGYFTNISFTEGANTKRTVGAGSQWEDEVLSGGANCVHAILARNHEQDVGNNIGVRKKGSSLSRYFKLHEAEGAGGTNWATFLVKADASKTIQLYGEDTAKCTFYDLGYFDSSVDFVEAWTQINQSAEGTWQTADLSAYMDQDGRIVNFILTHGTAAAEKYLGVRTPNALARYILVHESEDATNTDNKEYNGYTVSVLTSGTGTVQLYAGEDTTDYFWFAGYFKPTAAGPTPGWNKLQYLTEPPTGGAFNKLKFASEPPIAGAWNKILYSTE